MYSARINGEPTSFGTSGLLYRSNKLMYDRTTNSLWSQLLGEPVIGPLAGRGIELRFFPVILTTWKEWLEEHPDTTVLSLETGVYPAGAYEPETDPRAIYYDYFNSPDTMFPVWLRDDRLDTKDVILALSIGDAHKAYPAKALREERVVNDVLGGTELVIVASSESQGARVYLREGRRFSLEDEGDAGGPIPSQITDSEGIAWKVADDFLVNTNDPSQTLARVPSHMAFWFGWFAFHPDTEVYGVERGE